MNSSRLVAGLAALVLLLAEGVARAEPPGEAPPDAAPRTVGYLATGVGVVGLGVGAALEGATISKKSEASKHCSGGNLCDRQALDLLRASQHTGDAAMATLIAGGVLAGVGVALIVWAPRSERAPARSAAPVAVVVGPTSASIVGAF